MKAKPHTKTIAATFCAAFLAIANLSAPRAHALAVADFDDLNYFGSGPNRSALVIDWNDAKTDETLAWGFSWSGSLTAQDMLLAIAAADPRLFLRIDSDASFGLALFGAGYQTGSAPFSLTGAVDADGDPASPTFPGGVDDMNAAAGITDAPSTSSTVAPNNAADHYGEAWNDFVAPHNRFWELYLSGGSSAAATPSFSYPSWTSASFGLSGINLAHEGWFALSFSDPDYTGVTPGSAVAAVPEPGSATLLLIACAGAIFCRRPRHRSA